MKGINNLNKIHNITNIEEAVMIGLPKEGGLFLPNRIPQLSEDFWQNVDKLTFNEIAFEMSRLFFSDSIPDEDLKSIIDTAFDFDAPSVALADDLFCLELFHGPSMAFKDFGARFMAGVMSYYLKRSEDKLTILVATSGDTGGAVAQGFYKKNNIEVIILYPSGKVSDIQEKQLTTLGENVTAIELNGSFDDCQQLVKTAFLDEDLSKQFNLASANSINIARLIPQSFYYAYAYSRLKKHGKPIVFSVPSGNFGNLSAGVIAYKMGMPVADFLAATNVNKVVPAYLESQVYTPIVPSVSTISNAMDVGNPSNFPRLTALFHDDFIELKQNVKGYYYTDEQTREGMVSLEMDFNYVACPHTAIAYNALMDYKKICEENFIGVFLSTAHYAKFLPDVEATLGHKIEIPLAFKELLTKEKKSVNLENDFNDFKKYLMSR